jgi:RNase H-fold protein (predicted Holliday junction resolvase)
MIVLAFDQATRTSGWSVYRDKELIAHGTFTFTDSNLGLRLWKIRQKVEELYKKYLPDKIVYEDI